MAIGDVFQASIIQSDANTGEEISMNLFYESLTVEGSAFGLYTELQQEDGVLESLNGLQSTRIRNERLRVLNLFSLSDFYEGSLSGAGVHAGEMLPLFNAISFTKKVNTRAIRPGGLRVSGISEEASVGGLLTASGFPALLTAARGALALTINEDAVATYRPVVVKRVQYTIDEGLDSERQSYRLPANSGELVMGQVTTVLVNPRISHQVSRGNGR